jgi:alpha-tubulin suppressor-like RCC1 family protein
MALTMTRCVYAWGSNANGQLGLGHTQSQSMPARVISLEDKYIEYISMGDFHCAALSQEGTLYTVLHNHLSVNTILSYFYSLVVINMVNWEWE